MTKHAETPSNGACENKASAPEPKPAEVAEARGHMLCHLPYWVLESFLQQNGEKPLRVTGWPAGATIVGVSGDLMFARSSLTLKLAVPGLKPVPDGHYLPELEEICFSTPTEEAAPKRTTDLLKMAYEQLMAYAALAKHAQAPEALTGTLPLLQHIDEVLDRPAHLAASRFTEALAHLEAREAANEATTEEEEAFGDE